MTSERLPLWQRRIDRMLWGLLALLAAALLLGNIGVLLAQKTFVPLGFPFAVALLILAFAGLYFRWGPMIPCMFGGMITAVFLTDPISHSHMENVMKDLGHPIIGGIVGAAVGYVWDVSRRRQQ